MDTIKLLLQFSIIELRQVMMLLIWLRLIFKLADKKIAVVELKAAKYHNNPLFEFNKEKFEDFVKRFMQVLIEMPFENKGGTFKPNKWI